MIHSREGASWDAQKVGLGPPPIATDLGWLLVYHGVKATAAGYLYRAGLALLDYEDPTRVLAHGSDWVFVPQESYELSGDVPGVVFSTGYVLEPDGDTLRLHYGAADTCIAVALASVQERLDYLLDNCVCGNPHQGDQPCGVAAQGHAMM